jgi:YD repeat-containing protein
MTTMLSLKRGRGAVLAVLIGLNPVLTLQAGDTQYTYDALGRLTTVTRADGAQTIYTLDKAGNRVEVQEGMAPGVPATINYPSTNSTGSFTVSWTAPTGGTAVTRYELYEATSSNFSNQTRIYNSSALAFGVTGKGTATFYYRVRGCAANNTCGGYKAGGPIAVTAMLPGPPQDSVGKSIPNPYTWRAWWTGVSGASHYKVMDDAGQERTILHSAGYNEIEYACNGSDCWSSTNRPKWVQSCAGSSCGGKTNFPQ